MPFSIKCLLLGHDDSMARAPEKLWLRCYHCGRETSGWTLARSRPPRGVRPAPTPFVEARPVPSLKGTEHRVAA